MTPDVTTKADFCLKIDFEKSSENPSRVFRVMSDLIEAMSYLDNELVSSIDSRIEPILLLEDVETGSLKTWLAQALRHVPDDSLNNLEWQPIVGQFLVKGKWIFINFLEHTTEITDASQFDPLARQLQAAAEETKVNRLPHYTAPSIKGLMQSASKISSALSQLNPHDTASYITPDREDATFNLKLALAPDRIDDLLTVNRIVSNQEMILKVKKPDYLGDSMWEFRHGKQPISAKMADTDWLNSYRNREIDIRPGDCLVATVEITVHYGIDNEVVTSHHRVTKVKEVKPGINTVQIKLDYEA